MKKVLTVFILAVAAHFVLRAASAEAAPGSAPERSHVCMMQDTVLPNPGLLIEHEGRSTTGVAQCAAGRCCLTRPGT